MNFKLVSAKLNDQIIKLNPMLDADIVRFTLPPGSAPGVRHYLLQYTIEPVALRGLDADIFKLSVTGLGWAVPIERVTLRLETPTAPADNLTCYAGAQGSTTGSCTVDQQGNVANVTSYATLQPGESLSIFADFPHQSFEKYLQTDEAHPSSPARKIAEAAAVLALIIGAMVWLIRRRLIVAKSRADYTNANEAPKDQAHRK
jgi:hypothetical protein